MTCTHHPAAVIRDRSRQPPTEPSVEPSLVELEAAEPLVLELLCVTVKLELFEDVALPVVMEFPPPAELDELDVLLAVPEPPAPPVEVAAPPADVAPPVVVVPSPPVDIESPPPPVPEPVASPPVAVDPPDAAVPVPPDAVDEPPDAEPYAPCDVPLPWTTELLWVLLPLFAFAVWATVTATSDDCETELDAMLSAEVASSPESVDIASAPLSLVCDCEMLPVSALLADAAPELMLLPPASALDDVAPLVAEAVPPAPPLLVASPPVASAMPESAIASPASAEVPPSPSVPSPPASVDEVPPLASASPLVLEPSPASASELPPSPWASASWSVQLPWSVQLVWSLLPVFERASCVTSTVAVDVWSAVSEASFEPNVADTAAGQTAKPTAVNSASRRHRRDAGLMGSPFHECASMRIGVLAALCPTPPGDGWPTVTPAVCGRSRGISRKVLVHHAVCSAEVLDQRSLHLRGTIVGPEDAELGRQPRMAGVDLGGGRLLVDPPLAALLVLDGLDRVRPVDVVERDARLVEAAPQHAARLTAPQTGTGTFVGHIDHAAVVLHAEKTDPSAKKALKRALRDHGIQHLSWYSVDKGRKATKATTRAVADGAEVVVVCGGDGTVRAASQALVGTDVPLAVFPTGTANLFVNGLELPSDATAVAAAIVGGVRRRLDSATCNGLSFNVMAGTGFDAAMLDTAEEAKGRWGTLAYVRAGIVESRRRAPFPLQVRVDDKVVHDGEATGVLVANIGRLRAGVEALPDADPQDGLLDVAVITASGAKAWMALMTSAVLHRQQLSGHVEISRGTDVVVDLPVKHRFELDGGVKGKVRRLEIGLRPSSLLVCG